MKNNQGFTLIELVVALGLMAIALFGYFAVLKTVTLTRFAKHQALAYQVAIKKIEELKAVPFGSLPVSGSFIDSALSALPQVQANLTVANHGGSAGIKEITATISWQENGITKNVEVKTMLTSGGI
ncbi:MAG: prepilin-type N-terminal cleavage/methylation domain-containing protein [Patescibacteria group bacterium]